jgi:hypothetical protein
MPQALLCHGLSRGPSRTPNEENRYAGSHAAGDTAHLI